MSESLKSAVQSAVLRLLDPLVRWLMKAGIGVGDLLPLIKLAYVRAARDEARSSGRDLRRPNASRISVVTGLPRREVANILVAESLEPAGHERDRAQRAERVLAGWWNDPDFQDRLGEPAPLPLRGAKRSFAALVERYGGERWRVATMLEELLWVKAIRRLRDGRLKALSRTYATVRWNPQGVLAFGEQLAEHCTTLLHNLEHPSNARLVYRALNARVNPAYLPILLRDVREQAEGFARSIDNMLHWPRYTFTAEGSEAEAPSLGFALYLFESLPPEESAAAEGVEEPPPTVISRAARRGRRTHSSSRGAELKR